MQTISILIVNWNTRELLAGCLDSIQRAASPCVKEVIVVDNASADGSAEMVARRYPEVRLIRASSNLGFAKANNLAMAHASGSHFALVNSDALVHPGCLETLSRHLDDHPQVGLAGPRVLGADGQLQRSCRHLPGPWNTLCRALALDRVLSQHALFSGYEVPAADHDRAHEPEVLSGCFCVARRAAVEQVGGLDERFFFYGEDIDWCRRLRDAGWRLAFVPQALATHLGGGSSAQAPLHYSVQILKATLTYWRKHHGRAGAALCGALLSLHHGLRLAARVTQRALGQGHSAVSRHKLAEDLVCLGWLLFRSEVRGLR